MSDNKEYKLIKLDKDNYIVWKWQFQNVLQAKNLSKVLEEGEVPIVQDNQAKALLGSSLSDENILKIINCSTFKESWKILQQTFENKTTYESQSLYRSLGTYKISSAADISAGISELRSLVARLKNLGEKVSDNLLIGSILSALPESFNVFSTVWRNSATDNVDDLVSKLMAEASVVAAKEKDEAKALAVRGYKGKRSIQVDKDSCKYCKGKGHWIKDCPNLKTPYDPDKRKSKWQKESGKRQPNNEDSKNKPESSSQRDQSDINLSLMASIEITKFLDESIWVADSGCTHHMSPFKELFINLKLSDDNVQKGVHQAGGENTLKVEGTGDIPVDKGTLRNVLYVPGLSQNLYSIAAAAEQGITHAGLAQKMVFYKNDRELFTANLTNKLYLIKFNPSYKTIVKANAASWPTWHDRYSHVSMDTLKSMKEKNCVEGLEITSQDNPKCLDCNLNKVTKTSHPSRSTAKARQPGLVLHVDTAGPSNIVSKGGSKYLIVCKDEYSQYRQVAFTASKAEIPSKVKEFISRAVLETGNQVLKIMSDNGSEFKNHELDSFLNTRGIIHEYSTPYTPSQNGYIERDIRTIKEALKTILNKSKLEKHYWAEAANSVVYTLNRAINSSNKMSTPHELWFGTKPNVKNLRVFGEVAVLRNVSNSGKGSWDPKGSKGIFVGYTDRSNTYRFIEDGKIVVRCDAVFLQEMYNGEDFSTTKKQLEDFWVNGSSGSIEDSNTVTEDPEAAMNSDTLTQYENEVAAPERSNVQPNQSPAPPLQDSMTWDYDEVANPIQHPSSTVSNAEPSSEQNNATAPIQIGVVNPQINEHEARTETNIPEYFNTNTDLQFTVTQGRTNEVFHLSDLEYRFSANNWMNKRTGRFVGKKIIEEVKKRVEERDGRPQANLAHSLMTTEIVLPKNYQEAVSNPEKNEWIQAMNDEMASLLENNVFQVIPINQATKKTVGSRWVFSIKHNASGEIDKFKARIVAKGYSQIYGMDYSETYCTVAQITTIRLLLSYAASQRMHSLQFDIKTAFLYGELNEVIFMDPPDGYAQPGKTWRLLKSLYGLKQSPRMWNERFSNFMTKIGLKSSVYDHSVFYSSDKTLIVAVYVDDGLIISKNKDEAKKLIDQLRGEFKLRSSPVATYRGLQIETMKDGIFIHQALYTEKLLHTFNMDYSNPTANPITVYEDEGKLLGPQTPFRQVVGSLAYLAEMTRPDIAYTVNKLAQALTTPKEADWKRAKHLMRYLRGSTHWGIKYKFDDSDEPFLVGYCDSDFAGDGKTSKSTSGYILMFNKSPFQWKTQLQRHVTLSSTEAEVIAISELAKQLLWINKLIQELGIATRDSAIIRCDNTSALKIMQSERASNRTRHLRARNDFIVELIKLKNLDLQHVPAANQLADLLTKIVANAKFILNRGALMLNPKSSP